MEGLLSSGPTPSSFWVAVVVLGGIQAVTRDKNKLPNRGWQVMEKWGRRGGPINLGCTWHKNPSSRDDHVCITHLQIYQFLTAQQQKIPHIPPPPPPLRGFLKNIYKYLLPPGVGFWLQLHNSAGQSPHGSIILRDKK